MSVLTIDPKQAVGEGIIGGTTAGGVDAAGTSCHCTGQTYLRPKTRRSTAATGFANDLERVANNEGYNLRDVDTGSAKGARAAIDDSACRICNQI